MWFNMNLEGLLGLSQHPVYAAVNAVVQLGTGVESHGFHGVDYALIRSHGVTTRDCYAETSGNKLTVLGSVFVIKERIL